MNRTEAAAKALREVMTDDGYFFTPDEQVSHILAAADEVMFSGDPVGRLSDVMLDHRQSMNGRCMCGEMVGRSQETAAQHLARAVIAALKEAQG